MNDEVTPLANEDSQQYRDGYRTLLRWNILLALVAVGLTVILIFMNVTERQPHYFATTTNGYVIPLHSLSEPIVTNSSLLQWAEMAARSAYNFGFAHYQDDLNQAKPYFTPSAWQQFNQALDKSGLLKSVIDNKLEVDSVVSNPPVIIAETKQHGRVTWQLQVPLLLTFISANEQTHKSILVDMTIARVPVLSAPKGIQIVNFAVSNFNNIDSGGNNG